LNIDTGGSKPLRYSFAGGSVSCFSACGPSRAAGQQVVFLFKPLRQRTSAFFVPIHLAEVMQRATVFSGHLPVACGKSGKSLDGFRGLLDDKFLLDLLTGVKIRQKTRQNTAFFDVAE
jgi:hypothetical protein